MISTEDFDRGWNRAEGCGEGKGGVGGGTRVGGDLVCTNCCAFLPSELARDSGESSGGGANNGGGEAILLAKGLELEFANDAALGEGFLSRNRTCRL